jgi:Flp pilus assembly protein TadB
VIAVAVAWIVGGVVGWLVGAVCGVAFQRVFARLEPAATRGRRLQLVRDLPIALDLLSACLAAGTPVPAAVGAVGKAVGGPVGAEFAAVLAALDLGSTPAEAWQTLPAGPLRPIGRAIARAITSGAPLADVTAALAAEQRAALHAVAGAAARRAGVAAGGPLGVCFLPAFFGTAVVPIVAGLARHLAS